MPAFVAALMFLPWAIRNWLTFGSPLPGQTVKNALYISNFDVFPYRDQPSLAGYRVQVSSRSYYPTIDDRNIDCTLVRAQEAVLTETNDLPVELNDAVVAYVLIYLVK